MLTYRDQLAILALFLGSCLAFVVLLQYLARRFIEEEEDKPKRKVVRGQAVGTLKQALLDLAKNAPAEAEDPRTVMHGGLRLPRSEETKHKVVIGATGSGKTKTMLADLAAILPRLERPIGRETVTVVLYDDKRELPPVVAGMVAKDRVKLLNPFDRRCSAASVAQLFDTEARAKRLAEIYVPRSAQGESQPYWNNASRDVIELIVMTFNALAPGRWTLRDLHEALESPDRIRFVLGHTVRGRSAIRSHFSVETTAMNVVSNTRSAVGDFRPLAAVWDRAEESVDLRRIVREGGHVLILQPSEEHFTACRAANRLILTLILQFALDLPDSDNRLFFLLDEVQELGRIDLLPRATSVIRSKGGCLFYYTQLLDSFYKEYLEHDTHKIIDNIPNKAVFAVHGRTAKWASEQFGNIEIERFVDTKLPDQDEAKSKTQQFHRTDAVFADEVSRIPAPSPGRGISGLYKTRLTRAYFSTVTEFDRLLPRPVPGVKAFEPRPIEDEVLKPWDLADLSRLNFKIGPEDDLHAILGSLTTDIGPPRAEVAAPEREAPEDGVFGKLRTYFRREEEG